MRSDTSSLPLVLAGLVGGLALMVLLVATVVGVSADMGPPVDIRGDWRFDEGSGTTAYDSSSYGNDGEVHSASWVSGVTGQALEFSGTDDSYVEVPNAPELTPTTRLVIDAWIKPESYPAPFAAIVYKADLQQTGCYGERSYSLWATSYGGIEFSSTSEGESCQRYYVTPDYVIHTDEWSHVRVDLDTVEGRVQISVNDALVLQESHPQKPIKASNSPLRIGGMFKSNWDQSNFSGSIDEVKIYGELPPTPTPPPAVGGTVELHVDGAVSPTGLADTSSPASPPYAALVGGLAAAFLALTAGAWYARRRWIR